jgi:hypothetical protein
LIAASLAAACLVREAPSLSVLDAKCVALFRPFDRAPEFRPDQKLTDQPAPKPFDGDWPMAARIVAVARHGQSPSTASEIGGALGMKPKLVPIDLVELFGAVERAVALAAEALLTIIIASHYRQPLSPASAKTGFVSATPQQLLFSNGLAGFSSATTGLFVADKFCSKPLETLVCCGVADADGVFASIGGR